MPPYSPPLSAVAAAAAKGSPAVSFSPTCSLLAGDFYSRTLRQEMGPRALLPQVCSTSAEKPCG